MSRRRYDRDRNDPSLDSLLDTMANVVGILVVLVAVTQLSVGDAVERIAQRGVRQIVDPIQVETIEVEREAVADAIVAAQGELAVMEATEKRQGLLIEPASTLLEHLEGLPGRDPALDLEGLQETVERDTLNIAALKQEIAQTRMRGSRLDEILPTIPPETRPKVARLPDPRPPPKGAGQLVYVCRYGRVLALDVKTATESLYAGVERALGDPRATVDDREWLANHFRKENVGTDQFYWAFEESGDRAFFADLAWRSPQAGEDLVDLARGDSKYETSLEEKTARKHYARFWVWPDSFEVYLEARYIAEAAGFDVAWSPVPKGDGIGINYLGGKRTQVLID